MSTSFRNILITLLVSLAMLSSCNVDQIGPQRNAETRIHRLKSESKLVFAEYTLKELCGSKDETVLRILGDKEVLYRLTAHVTAGIDTQKIRPNALTVRYDSTAILYLPHCEVFDINIPEKEIENVYERVTGISRDFTADERNAVKRSGEKKINKTISKLDIKAKADARAEVFFRSLLVQAGFIPSKCIIQFE